MAALPKFSDTLMLTSILNLNQGGEGGGLSDYDQPLALPRLNLFMNTPLQC